MPRCAGWGVPRKQDAGVDTGPAYGWDGSWAGKPFADQPDVAGRGVSERREIDTASDCSWGRS
ncbi:hypothetical protein NGB36_01200 [Streptomyces sp. RB6PN25]|uniref:Uncharacterized protein n=1 Tax=Streptomyces humicola TaxID=2953240 RepID=A0ABT1PNL0_9ACTN|nr:hypothetical protein [Streptomyces humicola]MCQ4079260.1 hypothetical protein [Streptomyces humicola]